MMLIKSVLLALACVCLSASLVSAQVEGWWMKIIPWENCALRHFDYDNEVVTDKNITYTVHNETTLHLECYKATGGFHEGVYYGVEHMAYRTCYNNTIDYRIYNWLYDGAECKACGAFCNGCNLWGADAECDTCPPNAKDDNDTSTSSTCVCNEGYFNKWDQGVWEEVCRPLKYFCNLYADPWMLKNTKHAMLTIDLTVENPAQGEFSCAGDVGLSGDPVRTCRPHNDGWWFDWDDMSMCEQCGWGCQDCDSINEDCLSCFANAHDDGLSTSTCVCDPGWEPDTNNTVCVRSFCSFDLIHGDISPVNVGTSDAYTYFPDGSTQINFECDVGFFNSGEDMMTCNSIQGGSQFSGHENPPTCDPCGDLCMVCENRDRACTQCSPGSQDDGEQTATCKCYDGYKPSSINPFECVKANCNNAVIENGFTDPADGIAFTFDNVTFACDAGYELVGESKLSCGADILSYSSSWDFEFPECIDVNECLVNNGGCEHTCVNSEGSYDCECNVGWNLMPNMHGCEECDYQCDRCANGPENACTECAPRYAPTSNRSVCDCAPGWELADSLDTRSECIDVNECLVNNGGCEHTCVNTLGGYECQCDYTYSLRDDGLTCRKCGHKCETCFGGDIANCTKCITNAVSDGESSNSCECGVGWMNDDDDDFLCIDRNECLSPLNGGNGSCEADVAKCVNIPGSYRCSCPLGFVVDMDNPKIFEVDEENPRRLVLYTNCTANTSHLLEEYVSAAVNSKSMLTYWTLFVIVFISFVAKHM